MEYFVFFIFAVLQISNCNLINEALDKVSRIGVKCRNDPAILFSKKLIPSASWLVSNAISKDLPSMSPNTVQIAANKNRFLCFGFIFADYRTIDNVYSNMLLTKDYCDWAILAYSGQMHLLLALKQSARIADVNIVWCTPAEKPRY